MYERRKKEKKKKKKKMRKPLTQTRRRCNGEMVQPHWALSRCGVAFKQRFFLRCGDAFKQRFFLRCGHSKIITVFCVVLRWIMTTLNYEKLTTRMAILMPVG